MAAQKVIASIQQSLRATSAGLQKIALWIAEHHDWTF